METTTELQAQSVNEILVYVPQALDLNTQSVTKAKGAGQAILDTIDAEGMTPALYEQAQTVLKNITITYDKCYNRRAPFFRAVEDFRKQFTELEKQIDPKIKESIASKIQDRLNLHVAELAKQKAESDRLAKIKLAKDQEAISLKNDLNALLIQHVNSYIRDAKTYFNGLFETMTLETFEKDKANIAAPSGIYKESHFNSFAPAITSIHHSKEEVAGFISESMAGKYPTFVATVNTELGIFKSELVDKIPSKKTELEAKEAARVAKEKADKEASQAKTAQAKADALIAQQKAEDDQKRLAQEAEDRKKAEEVKLAEEKKQADLKAQQASEASKQAEQTQTLFDSQMNKMTSQQEVPQTKESYSITVLNPAGYLPIVAFYFEKEGMSKLPEDLEKKTLLQMKTFAEKHALKDDKAKIVSPYLVYKEVYKAVAKKS